MTLEQLPTRPPEFARPNVVLLRWPAQEQLREQLEAEGRPRLLLLTRECLAPVCADDLEDWVREPLDSDELERRGRTLERRARIRGLRPRVDEHGLIRVGERWVDLPAAQLPGRATARREPRPRRRRGARSSPRTSTRAGASTRRRSRR